MSGSIFSCHDEGEDEEATGTSGWEPGMLLELSQCRGHPPPQRTIWPEMSLVSRLRTPGPNEQGLRWEGRESPKGRSQQKEHCSYHTGKGSGMGKQETGPRFSFGTVPKPAPPQMSMVRVRQSDSILEMTGKSSFLFLLKLTTLLFFLFPQMLSSHRLSFLIRKDPDSPMNGCISWMIRWVSFKYCPPGPMQKSQRFRFRIVLGE